MAERDKFKQPGLGVQRKKNQRKQGGKGSSSIATGDASVQRGIANPEDGYTPPTPVGSKNVPFSQFAKENPTMNLLGRAYRGATDVSNPGIARFVSENMMFGGNNRIEQRGRQIASPTTQAQVEDYRDTVMQKYGSPEEAQAELDAAGRTMDNLGGTRSAVPGAQGVNKYIDDRTGATTYSDATNYDDAGRFDGPMGAFNLDEEGNQVAGGIGNQEAGGFSGEPTVNIGGQQYGAGAVHEVFGEGMRRTQAYNEDNVYLNDILNQPKSVFHSTEERARSSEARKIQLAKFKGDIGTKTAALGYRRIDDARQAEREGELGARASYRDSESKAQLGLAAREKAGADMAAADAAGFAASEKSRGIFAKIQGDLMVEAQKGYLSGNTLMKSMSDFAASDGYNPEIATQLEAKGLQLMGPQQREDYLTQKLEQMRAQNAQGLGA